MTEFLNGTAAMAFLTGAIYFYRFWRETHDRFFVYFAAAFGLFFANRVVAASLPSEKQLAVYVVRLLAFVVILAAIIEKNRGGSQG